MEPTLTGTVVAVSRSPEHALGKANEGRIRLVPGLGVEGDAHYGATVQHLSRMRRDPAGPNLRQVHLIHAELHDELAGRGMPVRPGEMGENVTTRGIDLLGLPVGTVLRLGHEATVALTGLRNPCAQLDALHPGLMAATVDRAPDGTTIRKTGVMAVVLVGGEVGAGDPITGVLPPAPRRALRPV